MQRDDLMFSDGPLQAFAKLRRAASDGAELRCIAACWMLAANANLDTIPR
ncbi:hypothetical protein [Burkholderia perseverans]|nr:hypothetical protein [Burkholderia perseverans]